jgi:excisionase family DNA binding protein
MLTSTKLGKALGLTKITINRLAKEGRIPFIILPSGHRRFDLAEVKAALSTDVTPIFADSGEEENKETVNGDGK